MGLHGSELVCGDLLFRGDFVVVWETPPLGTGTFAGFTAYAKRTVVKNCLWHIEIFISFLAEIGANV
jgi:hypothetical protein